MDDNNNPVVMSLNRKGFYKMTINQRNIHEQINKLHGTENKKNEPVFEPIPTQPNVSWTVKVRVHSSRRGS